MSMAGTAPSKPNNHSMRAVDAGVLQQAERHRRAAAPEVKAMAAT